MKIVDLNKYGPIIGSRSIGEEIFEVITKELDNNSVVVLDVGSLKSMATFCAKQIFGRLYVQMGAQEFFERINIKGADRDLKTIIQIGIQHAIEEVK